MSEKKFTIQEILSLGYVYLLILGVLTDTIYYSFFDINIIEHSDILDILLSPINILTDHWIIPVAIILFCVLFYFFQAKIAPKLYEKRKRNEAFRQKHNIEKLDIIYNGKPKLKHLTPIFALIIFSMFIGFRAGGGGKIQHRMKNNDLTHSTIIEFQNGEKINSYIIGRTSTYLFYVVQDDNKLTIAPIAQNIRTITKSKKVNK